MFYVHLISTKAFRSQIGFCLRNITTAKYSTEMVNTLLIVRHSERIDESKVIDEKASWKQFVANDKSKRNKRDLQDDPILTKRGVLIAKDAAQSLYSLLNTVNKSSVIGEKGVQKSAVSGASAVSSDDNASNMARKSSSSSSSSNSSGRLTNHSSNSNNSSSSVKSMPIDRIYTSRLRRCVETAYQLALLSHLPLYVCTGLALTAIAVERRKGTFEFHSMQEIRRFCPGVRVVSCDNDGEECAETRTKKRSEEKTAEISAVDRKVCSADGDVEFSSEERAASDVNFKVESDQKDGMKSTIISAQSSSTAESPSQYYIPTDDWLLAITAIAERHPYSVIVAHR